MSDGSAPDSYATAKANLRDTIKWLATSLSAVGAAVIAGASINGLATLKGEALFGALVLGGVGLGALLRAISILLRLLTAKVFYFSDLSKETGREIADEINQNASDILSPQTKTIAALVEFREKAIQDMKGSKPGDVLYQDAFKRWAAANGLISHVLNMAQFIALRNDFKSNQSTLFFLAIVVIGALGSYSLLVGAKPDQSVELSQKVTLTPGEKWADVAESLTTECGAEPLHGAMMSRKSFEGWATIRLLGPGKCSGLELSVPASLVTLVGPQRP